MESVRPLASVAADQLIWLPGRHLGFYPVKAGVEPYDEAYFTRFQEAADTFVGRQLMHCRVDFVKRHFEGMLVDVGIGSGAFIAARRARGMETFGYDVNPAAKKWLGARGLALDPNRVDVPAISLWDVFEHIPDYGPLLKHVDEWVFMSLPIFTGPDHVYSSKHFRRDEHYWYFTEVGLVAEMARHGFALAESNRDECLLGREDIGSFAFQRVGKAIT